MFHIALYQPEIPPNTGNIIRLCANTGAHLHLIHPLKFELTEKKCRRAGLDYHEWASTKHYTDYQDFINSLQPKRVFACTTKATTLYSEVHYQPGDVLLFGPETRGLPPDLLTPIDHFRYPVKIPMQAKSRSLNLSNAVAVILYEALRQFNFNQQSLNLT